ncbi:MAG: GNAT family N-acetyltransferase [Proteobacteria bacterium]|nr:GNAT family N-acetyltransferase [Pseudomonadota bacterium]
MWIAHEDIPNRDLRLERLRDALFADQPLFEALILEVEGHPAGFCTFHTSFSTYRGQLGIFLEDLFVRDSFQRSGLGKQLMAKLATVAKDRGCNRIVWNVPADDGNLQRFYKGFGARKAEEWTMTLHGKPLDELALSAAEWTKKPK